MEPLIKSIVYSQRTRGFAFPLIDNMEGYPWLPEILQDLIFMFVNSLLYFCLSIVHHWFQMEIRRTCSHIWQCILLNNHNVDFSYQMPLWVFKDSHIKTSLSSWSLFWLACSALFILWRVYMERSPNCLFLCSGFSLSSVIFLVFVYKNSRS